MSGSSRLSQVINSQANAEEESDMTEEKMTMADDDFRNMPETSRLMTPEEFAGWISTRKEAGAAIEIEIAELKGWWSPDGDPYGLSLRAHREAPSYENLPELSPHYFVRDQGSRGWVWQGDLPDDKRAATQARIDEHDRKVKEFYADRRAAGCLIDIDTCERFSRTTDGIDPYGIELAPYGCTGKTQFVYSKDSGGPICVEDLPAEKWQALNERAERERLAHEKIVDDLFEELRRGCDELGVRIVISEAEKAYGEKTVEVALWDYNYPYDVIGGSLIKRGYLTMEDVTELLRGKPRRPVHQRNGRWTAGRP
jgi:hypothetical protein